MTAIDPAFRVLQTVDPRIGPRLVAVKPLPHKVSYFQDNNGTAPIHFAAASGNLDLVKLLVQKGAKPDPVNTMQGMTPLHWAAGANHAEVVKFLLEQVPCRGHEAATKTHGLPPLTGILSGRANPPRGMHALK